MSIIARCLAAAGVLATGLSASPSFAEEWWHCRGVGEPVSWVHIREGRATLLQDSGVTLRTGRATLAGWAAVLGGNPVAVHARFDNGWYAYQDLASQAWYFRIDDRSMELSCERLADTGGV
jgi:hypothetical protein